MLVLSGQSVRCCSCMLLLHPVPTSTDAGPDLCTLHPDLCTLHLWYFPSFNWCKHSTCTRGGSPSATCTGPWCFFIHPLAQNLHLHSGNLHCVVVVCVVVVVYMDVVVYTGKLHWHFSNLHCVVVFCVGGRCMRKWR